MEAQEAEANSDGAETISDLESKIIRQIEYYFGDFNLSRDKYLREQIRENEGWIPLETMVRFNRLKQLSEDYVAITTALKKAPNKLMEVNEDGTKIRRSLEKPVADLDREQTDKRSVYVKGFKMDTTLDELLEFFKQYWNPENICMRRKKQPNKKFKGSVFLTFSTADDADKFLELKDVKYKGMDLLRERKVDYVKRKAVVYEEIKKEKEEKQSRKEKEKENSEAKQETCEVDIVRGCLLKLTGLPEGTLWEDIKETLAAYGSVAYVDYTRGLPQAIVRFSSGVASEVLEKAGVKDEDDGARKIKIGDVDVEGTIIEDEEEIAYWRTIASAKSRMKMKGGNKKGWSNRGGRHKGNKGQKRKHGNREHHAGNKRGRGDGEEPAAKIMKNNDSVPVKQEADGGGGSTVDD